MPNSSGGVKAYQVMFPMPSDWCRSFPITLTGFKPGHHLMVDEGDIRYLGITFENFKIAEEWLCRVRPDLSSMAIYRNAESGEFVTVFETAFLRDCMVQKGGSGDWKLSSITEYDEYRRLFANNGGY